MQSTVQFWKSRTTGERVLRCAGFVTLLFAFAICSLFSGPEVTPEAIATATPTAVAKTETSTPSPTNTPTPGGTPKPTPTSAPTEEDIRSALERVLEDYEQVTLLGVSIAGRQLTIEVAVDRASPEVLFEALGVVHGTIAQIEPDVDKVTIMDISGQGIAVEMSKLIAHYKGEITFQEFRESWEIIYP